NLNTRPSSNRSVSTPIRLLSDLNSLAITGLIVQAARAPIGTRGLILVQVKSDRAGVPGLILDLRSTVHAPRISSPTGWTEILPVRLLPSPQSPVYWRSMRDHFSSILPGSLLYVSV